MSRVKGPMAFRVFLLFMAGVVFFGSFLIFFSEAQMSEKEFFSYALGGENISFSYPPYLNQSDDYVNVVEDEGALTKDISSDSGYYSDIVSGNGTVSWRTFTYNAQVNAPRPSVTIITSDYADFREIKNTLTFDIRTRTRVEDLSQFKNSRYLKWTISFETDGNFDLNSVDITGYDQSPDNRYTTWLLVFLSGFVLVVLSFILYGIFKIWSV